MTKEFKITMPLDIAAELRRARREALQADQLAEFSHMRLSEIYRVLKFTRNQTLTPEGENALKKLDRATDALSNTRGDLGDAVRHIEMVLKEAGEPT